MKLAKRKKGKKTWSRKNTIESAASTVKLMALHERRGGRVVYRDGLENRAFYSRKVTYRDTETNHYERCCRKSIKILSIDCQ